MKDGNNYELNAFIARRLLFLKVLWTVLAVRLPSVAMQIPECSMDLKQCYHSELNLKLIKCVLAHWNKAKIKSICSMKNEKFEQKLDVSLATNWN